MRYITEQELRDQFSSGLPERFALPPGTRLTPSARQYLMDLHLSLEDVPVLEKAPEGIKPEHMTHLDRATLVVKSHPRIVLRGKLDSLEADILCAQVTAEKANCPRLVTQLGDALTLVRCVLSADFNRAPLAEQGLGGFSLDEIREASHHPTHYLAEGHVLPNHIQGELAALLNQLRTRARETELEAVIAYKGESSPPKDIIRALNRLSSYFYVLQLQIIARQRESGR